MKIWLQKLIPQHTLSRLIGQLAQSRISWLKNLFIAWSIKKYQVNMDEAETKDYRDFLSFNDFFTRPLQQQARPMPTTADAIASPADGYVSELGHIKDQQVLQAKGHYYSLPALLGGDHQQAALFQNGVFFTAYLSPKDYHRVHMPFAGTLEKMVYVPGTLFSVNPETVNHLPGLFARNERVICYFHTTDLCPMAIILVGAVIVASIATVWHGTITPSTQTHLQQWSYCNNTITLNRGDEMGRFLLGSTVIVLFADRVPQVTWSSTLSPGTQLQLGKMIGTIKRK